MSESVHGHAVLNMLLAAPMSREALRQATEQAHGANARYHTCSDNEMPFDGLLEFLFMRRKISERDGLLVAHREEMCDHE